MFQENDSWWDLLCILDLPNNTGTVKSAEEKRSEDAKTKSGHTSNSSGAASSSTGSSSSALAGPMGGPGNDEGTFYLIDFKFISAVISAVQAKVSEEIVRQKFFDFTNAIVTQAQALQVIKSWQQSLILETPTAATPLSPTLTSVRKGPGSQANSAHLKKMLNSNFGRSSALLDSCDFRPFAITSCKNTSNLLSPVPVQHETSEVSSDPDNISMTPFSSDPQAASCVSPLLAPISKPEDLSDDLQQFDDEGKYSASSSDTGTPDSNRYLRRPVASDAFLLKAAVFRLQHESGLSQREIFATFSFIERGITTELSAQECLVLFPESLGGIHAIASGLFSPNPNVRMLATKILQKFELFQSCRPVVDALNAYLRCAYSRNVEKQTNGQLASEIACYLSDGRVWCADDSERAQERPDNSLKLSSDDVLFAMAGLSMDWTNLAVAAGVSGTGTAGIGRSISSGPSSGVNNSSDLMPRPTATAIDMSDAIP